MKVTLEKEYKQYYTLADLERAKEVIRLEKEDESTAASWAVYAVNEVLSYLNCSRSAYYAYADESDILKATARTAKNNRVWDAHGNGTQNMDVWIEAKAFTHNCFIEVGAYLSDIWKTGGETYVNHIFYRVFEEKHHSW